MYTKTEIDNLVGGANVLVKIIDDISLQFNGVTTTFNILFGGNPVTINDPEELQVSLNGVIQSPVDAYTVSGSQITFAEAPKTTAECFIIWFQPSDALVQKMLLTGYVEAPIIKNYPQVPWGTFDFTVTGIYIATEQGTMDISVLINNAPALGLTNIAVSNAPTLIENLSLLVGGNRKMDISVNSSSSAANLEYTIFTERIMA